MTSLVAESRTTSAPPEASPLSNSARKTSGL
jgi:hypothetical protein